MEINNPAEQTSPPPSGGMWTFIETLSPSASSGITSSTLPVYDEYLVIVDKLESSAATADLNFRLNADTGNNYGYQGFTTTAIAYDTGQSSIKLTGMNNVGYAAVQLFIQGLTHNDAVGLLGVIVSSSSLGTGFRGCAGYWAGGNATQVASLTFFPSTGTITGQIQIFGRDRSA